MKLDNLLIKNNFDQIYLEKKTKIILLKKYKKFLKDINQEIENRNKTLNVLSEKIKYNFKINDLKRFKRYQNIAIIGMGGSILGAEAIHKFFENHIKKKIYFFNNIDEENLLEFKKKKISKETLFLVISKSGNTVETLTNSFDLDIFKKYSKNTIIITEKKNSTLFALSKKFNLFFIEHKKHVGGRYSVLSEVGLIPAYLMGINIKKLKSKALKSLKGKNKQNLKEGVLTLVNLLNSKRINNYIFLNYSPKLERFLFWCQQLIAESLGKENKGFLPVISNVPKDHHSLLQLYLDGPKDKIFHVFSVDEEVKRSINTGKITNFKNFLLNKKIKKIKFAQKEALVKSFKKNKIPFREFKIKKLNEETLGELFSYFILETILIGKIININPFNQPAVEQVKKYTKKILN